MNLQDCRTRIDIIDDQIINLLKQRFTLSKMIGEYKQKNGIVVFDPSREQQILTRAADGTSDLAAPVTAVYQTILEQSKKIQNK